VPRHDAAAIARAGQAHGLSAKNTEALLGELEGAPHVGAPGLARASSSSPFADDKAEKWGRSRIVSNLIWRVFWGEGKNTKIQV